MLETIRRYAAITIGIALCAALGVIATGVLTSERGAVGPTILGSSSPIISIAVVAGLIVVMSVIGGVVGRLVNTVVGLFVVGAGLYALDGRLETVEELVWAGGVGWALPIESLILAGLALISVTIVFGIAGPLQDVEPEDHAAPDHWLLSKSAMISAAAGILVVVAVWFMARGGIMKGQMIGVVFVGSMLAGLAGRLLAPNVQPRLIFIAPCIFGAVAQAIGLMMSQTDPQTALASGALPVLIRPVPLDFIAGGLMGVAVGLGWARSFLHHEEADDAEASPTPAA